MEWTFAARSDTGLRRSNNEDSVAVRRDLGVIVVADGMGGHAAGEVASRLAVDAVTAALEAAGFPLDDADRARESLAHAVRAANRVVFDAAANDPRFRGMGTTLTAAVVLPV
ncbi:MAG TPA: protein phosphatase 2C domain-containing protein, partial [Longimicrobiales bacterium]|nr:protein phosphatase 2C domain-containing protein [Longimicrobiales bacterium]